MNKPEKYLYAYNIPSDTGFAPCYHEGVLTLATCKPRIRLHAWKNREKRFGFVKKEDTENTWKKTNDSTEIYLLGIKHKSSLSITNGIYPVYLAKIDEIISFEDYYTDEGKYSDRYDCIYRDVKSLEDPQEIKEDVFFKDIKPNLKMRPINDKVEHARPGEEDCLRTDYYGNCVLLSRDFKYFGKKGIDLIKQKADEELINFLSSLNPSCLRGEKHEGFTEDEIKIIHEFYQQEWLSEYVYDNNEIQPIDWPEERGRYTGTRDLDDTANPKSCS